MVELRPDANMILPKDPRSKWYHKYNIFSRTFFCWVDPLLWYGSRHILQHEDLYAHPAEADSKYLLKVFKRYWNIETTKHKHGGNAYLWLVILKCIWWPFWIQGILSAIENFALIPVSLFLGNIVDYFCIESPSLSETRNAYLNALGITIMTVIFMISILIGAFQGLKLGMTARIICATALYEKVLSLSQNTISNLTIGHIVNLSSNDIHRFDLALSFPHFIWSCLLSIFPITYILYNELGSVSFLAVAMVIIQIPILIFLSKLLSTLRLKAAKVTDKRVKVMNEVISGIRVIKMYGWENAFHQLVSSIRREEMSIILRSSVIRAIYLSLFLTSLPTNMFVIFSVHAALGEEITKRKIFITLSLLGLFKIYFNFIFVFAVSQLAECLVALKRIKKFLLIDENIHDLHVNEVQVSQTTAILGSDLCETTLDNSSPSVTVCDLSASWSGTDDKLTLTKISFKTDQDNPILAVIGAVGAGKSTLLHCLLGEVKPICGTLNVIGTVAYAGQEPWIFSATLRDNILFGEPYHPDWYATVIDMCALEKDIEILQNGDMTLVGERGVALSGGQKARVSLARAVYRKAGVYLLDDPLSAVDAAVSRHIFDKCIKGFLSQSSIVVLVTHQLQYVHKCDNVLVIKEGCVSFYGDPNDNNFKDVDNLTISEESNKSCQFVVRKQSFVEISPKIQFNPLISPLKEADEKTLENEDNFINGIPAMDAISNTFPFTVDKPDKENYTTRSIKVQPEERGEGSISLKTYHEYFNAGGGIFYTFGMFFVFILAEVAAVISDWWIANWCRWCESGSSNQYNVNATIIDLDAESCSADCQNISNPYPVPVCIGIYGGLVGSVWILAIARTVLFYIILLRASTLSHNKMFISVLRSPVLFFDTNPIGRILNRFSKDIGFMDDVLIYIFCEFLQFFTKFLAIIITASIANYYLVVAVIVMMIFCTIFRWFYLKTAREIKRLESSARSPLYSHISMTLQGLPTIRAYGQQVDLLERFYDYQNKHTQTWYLYLVAARWFGGRIDVICVVFYTLLVFLAIPLAGSIDAAVIGLALTYSATLTGLFQYCIRGSAEVENLMVSAERVMAYGKLQSEGALESYSDHPPTNWPTKGHIEITDLSYKYSTNGPLVLQGINCSIAPGEKVGIVGRTGAGKSSLIGAFFRLAEPSGSIKIDGVECFNIGLHDLRPNISIIPQDPVLFSETVRYNLDPFNQHDDEAIWTALKQVQLDCLIESLDGGLASLVSEGGNNFSVGQKQLFCLARALLKQNKILVLDEATANVDYETDAVIQQVLREQFVDCTVLTIAHRLDTVMDADKIMVLRNGQLLEYGEPQQLLSNTDSYLLKLVIQTGPVAAEKLMNTALMHHNRTIISL